jgi:hypothetical protein
MIVLFYNSSGVVKGKRNAGKDKYLLLGCAMIKLRTHGLSPARERCATSELKVQFTPGQTQFAERVIVSDFDKTALRELFLLSAGRSVDNFSRVQ